MIYYFKNVSSTVRLPSCAIQQGSISLGVAGPTNHYASKWTADPQIPSGTEHMCVCVCMHTQKLTQAVQNAEKLCLMEGTDSAGVLLYCKQLASA